MKLFAIYVGGTITGAHVELHDMRFCVGNAIEDCYPALRAQWWGTPESLHVDCWGEIKSVDGYALSLKPEPYTGEDRVYFVNLGGYDPADFTELHKNIFVAAPTESKAKVKALKTILEWQAHHRDYLYDIETMVCLDDAAREKGLYIHLEPTDNPAPFEFTCKYQPLDVS